jgi:hypothetical protein
MGNKNAKLMGNKNAKQDDDYVLNEFDEENDANVVNDLFENKEDDDYRGDDSSSHKVAAYHDDDEDDDNHSVEFAGVTFCPYARNATSSDDDVKFVKVEQGPPHRLSSTNRSVRLSQLSGSTTAPQLNGDHDYHDSSEDGDMLTMTPTKRRAKDAPAAYGGAEERKRSANSDSRKDNYVALPWTQRLADEPSEISVDGDCVKRPPANYDQLPTVASFRGRTRKGNPVAQTGVWKFYSYRASETSIVGEPFNDTKKGIVDALMRGATSRPYSGCKKKSKSLKAAGSEWGHSDAIYGALCTGQGCEKQFQVCQSAGILAVYTFKDHHCSGCSKSNKADSTTICPSSMNDSLPYVQDSGA